METDIKKRILSLQSEAPVVSIVIPAYNEEKYLLPTIEALSKIKTHYPTEIILVDNGSTDNTKFLAESCGLKVIEEKQKGTSYARQAGLMAAKGEYIFTTDADSIVPATWVEESMHYFQNNKNLCFLSGGSQYGGVHWSFHWMKYVIDTIRKWSGREPKCPAIYGYNSVFKKDIAIQMGGYSPGINLGEDLLLAAKIGEKGDMLSIQDMSTTVITSGRRFSSFGKVLKYIMFHWVFERSFSDAHKLGARDFADIR
ncbi:MAG: glycosyltransferase [Candidatus Gracilibacteria bacterium]